MSSECFSIFALAPLTLHQLPKTKQDTSTSTHQSACTLCPGSEKPLEQHLKTEWHRYNASTNAQYTQEQYNKLDESEEESDSEQDQSDAEKEEREIKRIVSKTPYIHFQNPNEANTVLPIYKAMIVDRKSYKDVSVLSDAAIVNQGLAKLASKDVTILIILMGSGNFTAAILNAKAEIIKSKSLHRYTTRRKQGGGQAAQDNKNGNAQSAGAMLRRYNETELLKDIETLLNSWKSEIDKVALILTAIPSRNKNTMYTPTFTAFTKDDKRIKSIPIAVKKAKTEEAIRVFQILTIINPIPKSELALPEETSRSPNLAKSRIQKPKPEVEKVEAEPIDPRYTRVIELIKKQKKDLLGALLSKDPTLLEMPDILHTAASQDASSVITLLLARGVNPTLTNGAGQTAYDLTRSRDSRWAFRREMYRCPDAWDWKAAHVPSGLSPEQEDRERAKDAKKDAITEAQKADDDALEAAFQERQREKEKEQYLFKGHVLSAQAKSVLERQADLVNMSAEARKKLDREQRARAAEARLKNLRK